MEAVRQYVDYFNKGDVKAMAATCAVPASILDGLAPPYGRGRRPARSGTETCCPPVNEKGRQDIS